MHIPSIAWLMLCDDPVLQLSPEQQTSMTLVLHGADDEGHLGKSIDLVSQVEEFGLLHLL